MLYIYGFLFAAQLVLGQAFWKIAVDRGNFALTSEFLFSRKLISFLTSPVLLLGVFFYLSATVLNMWMLTKYELNSIQLVAIPLTLTLIVFVGWRLFGESVQPVNILGIAILIVGVGLATIR